MVRTACFAIVVTFFVTIGVQFSSAQGTATPARPQATPASTRPATIDIPVSRVALIFSADFQDAKTGIARYIVAVNKLNAEFQPLQTELTATAQRLSQLQAEINAGTNLPPVQLQAKIDQLDQQKKTYQRKGEDAQASYQKRRTELLGPLQDEVAKALDTYAQAHGITLIIDGSRVPIIYAADNIDITKAFIADYNSKNPASAPAPK